MSNLDSNERLILGRSPPNVVEEHIERYIFAKKYIGKKRVLDIACGSGYGSAMLAQAGATYVVGADISQDVVRYASNQYKKVNNCHFLVMDGLQLGWIDKSFDVIVCYETIEHVMQPDILLREFKRILKPEGILLISTPNPIIANFSYGWRRLFIKKPSNPFHCMEYSLKEFCYLVERDFEIIYIGGQRFLPRLFAGYFVGIALSFPILGKCVSDGFYSSLNKSSANVKSLLKRKVPSFFILVCQRRNKLGSD